MFDPHSKRMNTVYRYTRHCYDISRKFFLLGRDGLLEELGKQDYKSICEVGCGTGRNLIKLAKMNSSNKLFGLDASDLMLKKAEKRIKKLRLEDQICLYTGLAEEYYFNKQFDILVFSYSLSMVADYKKALNNALEHVSDDGVIYVLDFGNFENFPNLIKKLMYKFLKIFSVYPGKNELFSFLKRNNVFYETRDIAGGYSFITKLTKS